ncbi:P-loop containing nucleoside triphosphate hydrolase protein [Boletus reticuloceps]|uniref:P-loop containing nucleoside triphosphate hydrolase protein n=1 Tax=Boletus reticuloceps TaxID=495285 RepID=A0A8I3A8G5_9AGAM|nr:P-loop containing nucleoside triphosphate hydrolase protein [Boletus reticuloceps]
MGQILACTRRRQLDKFADEERKLPHSPIVAPPVRETIYIVVMGSTGSGKTTFINLASGSNLREGSSLESCTDEVQTSTPFHVGRQQVVLIDTPGFDDTNLTDTDVLKLIAAYLVTTNKQGARLAGVIYMHRISDLRVGGSARRDFRMFQELCGEEAYPNVIIVTNMWGTVTAEDGNDRERELATKDIFFKLILDQRAKMLRHDHTKQSAHQIIQNLIDKETVVLQIQRELGEGMDITQTAAYKQLDKEMSELAARHQKELKALEEEMADAERSQDEETRGELQEEVRKVEAELEKAQSQAARLASDYQTELRRIEEILQVKEG